MKRTDLFAPFPIAVHITLWLIYFLTIGIFNISAFGWGHLWVLAVMIPIMLGISYLNRYALRQVFKKKFADKKLWLGIAGILLVLILGYHLLYDSQNMLSRRMLPEIDTSDNERAAYAMEAFIFYASFAIKGVGLAGAELLFNVLRAWRRMQLARKREEDIRLWVSHFMGNLGQSLAYAVRKGANHTKLLEAYIAIWMRSGQIMARGSNFFSPLEEEISYLRHLMTIYQEKKIALQVYGDTHDVRILSMLLLTLYKDMYKHGNFEEEGTALFHIARKDGRLHISTRNRIADKAAWVYGEGGTGFARLEAVLKGQYPTSAHITHYKEDQIFFLRIEIPLKNECIEHCTKTGIPKKEAARSGGGR